MSYCPSHNRAVLRRPVEPGLRTVVGMQYCRIVLGCATKNCHAEISLATDLDIYFCDPHSPWQRGTNENTNGLLRQYFPRGTDLSRWSAEEIQAVAAALNGRPRKILG